MLDFRVELNKIQEAKRVQSCNRAITGCLRALLSDFRKMETVHSKSYYFRRYEGRRLVVIDCEGEGKILFEQTFKNVSEIDECMEQIKKYFTEQDYKVDETNCRVGDFSIYIEV